MNDKPTICLNCAHLYRVNKNDAAWRWLCMAAPMPKWFSFVLGELIADPPYQFCAKKNFGDCVDYREGVNSLSPDLLNPDGTPKDDD